MNESAPTAGSGIAPTHIRFRLSAQRALLGHVTPPLRSVSISVNELKSAWSIRFVFDGEPSESQLEEAKVATTEILADFPDWDYSDEFLFIAAPTKIPSLDWVVFARCEYEWVGPDK
jgi:hypothetical protein